MIPLQRLQFIFACDIFCSFHTRQVNISEKWKEKFWIVLFCFCKYKSSCINPWRNKSVVCCGSCCYIHEGIVFNCIQLWKLHRVQMCVGEDAFSYFALCIIFCLLTLWKALSPLHHRVHIVVVCNHAILCWCLALSIFVWIQVEGGERKVEETCLLNRKLVSVSVQTLADTNPPLYVGCFGIKFFLKKFKKEKG